MQKNIAIAALLYGGVTEAQLTEYESYVSLKEAAKGLGLYIGSGIDAHLN